MTTIILLKKRLSFCHICVGILLFLIILPVSAIGTQNLQSALPQGPDVTPSLDITNGWKFQESGVSSNLDSIVTWGGYRPFSCPKENSRVAKRKGDYLIVEVFINHHDNSQTANEHTEWVLSYPDEREMTVTDTPPNSITALSSYDSSDGELTNNICEMYVWVDPNTRFTVKVTGEANKGIVEEAGCTPSYAERQATMKTFVKSEAVRLSNLVYGRLKGDEDIVTSSSPYDPLLSLLAGYIPDPWGMYQTSDRDLLLAALQQHDTEPEGATYILRTQLLPWYEQFQKEIKSDIDCGGDFYTSTSSWVELIPVILGLPKDFSDLVRLPTPLEILKRGVETGKKASEIFTDHQNEESYRDLYSNYCLYREGITEYDDKSNMENFLEIFPSARIVKQGLKPGEFESLLDDFEAKYRCEKKKEALQKLKDNERAIVAAKIQEFSSDLRKIERTFEELLEEKRNTQ